MEARRQCDPKSAVTSAVAPFLAKLRRDLTAAKVRSFASSRWVVAKWLHSGMAPYQAKRFISYTTNCILQYATLSP